LLGVVGRSAWVATIVGLGALLLTTDLRADVAAPNQRIVDAELVFTGLGDFADYRFVLAALPVEQDDAVDEDWSPPEPVEVSDGTAVEASTVYFQQLRALSPDAPRPVSDAWLASSEAPSSGMVNRRPLRVPEASDERVMRATYRVRQVRAGWISTELESVVAEMADGSSRTLARPIPRVLTLSKVQAPDGWALYWMAHPSWPSTDPPIPAVACSSGDDLPLSPGPRTLVAVEGGLAADGTPAGRAFVAWDARFDAWGRDGVAPESPAVAQRFELEVDVRPGQPLGITMMKLYEDGDGRRFYDAEGTIALDEPFRGWWAIVAGGALVAAALGGFWVRRRKRLRQG
jgi:hypothetical protein